MATSLFEKYVDVVDLNEAYLPPNPYVIRERFLKLDGYWDFDFTDGELKEELTKKIVVPFAPETLMSEIGKKNKKKKHLHYRKRILLPTEYMNSLLLLKFLNVDQVCDVYWNNVFVGHHEGGYFPFSFEITPFQRENVIDVIVKDDVEDNRFARGKQSRHPSGIFYTETSGIFGSVYLEPVPKDSYIEHFFLRPSYDDKSLEINVIAKGVNPAPLKAKIYFADTLILSCQGDVPHKMFLDLKDVFFPWSPDNPALYKLVLTSGKDKVTTHFGFRKIERRFVGGFSLIYLNEKPIMLSGVLDQGYFFESGLTPPDIKTIYDDVKFIKDGGFNLIRKHIKIENPWFYYFCDYFGIVVNQDFINSGDKYSAFYMTLAPFLSFKIDDRFKTKLGRNSTLSREHFEKEMEETVYLLKGITCISIWTLFNEGWGQFETMRLTGKLRSLDDSRLIDSNSGWFDQGVGDFSSHHIYFRKVKLNSDHKRILALSEFGGYSFAVKDHKSAKHVFGYKRFFKRKTLIKKIYKLYEEQIIPLIKKEFLSELVFTQFTDVESEMNGLLTMDREFAKVPLDDLKKINQEVYEAFKNAVEEKIK